MKKQTRDCCGDSLRNPCCVSQLCSYDANVKLRCEEDDEAQFLYKVLTSIAGFVNCSVGISQRPNCCLQFDASRPLGERSLILKVTSAIQVGRELTISYGPNHPCGQTRAKRKHKGKDDNAATPAKKRQRVMPSTNQAAGEAEIGLGDKDEKE